MMLTYTAFQQMPKAKLTSYLQVAPLSDATPAAKLIWLYVAEHGEDAYTVRGIADALKLGSFMTAKTALDDLYSKGLLNRLEEGKGGRAARYKAICPDGNDIAAPDVLER